MELLATFKMEVAPTLFKLMALKMELPDEVMFDIKLLEMVEVPAVVDIK